GRHAEVVDEMVDTGDEAERLPRAGSRDHEDGAERRFNGEALLGERLEVHAGIQAISQIRTCFQENSRPVSARVPLGRTVWWGNIPTTGGLHATHLVRRSRRRCARGAMASVARVRSAAPRVEDGRALR